MQTLDKLNELAEQVASQKGLRVYDLQLLGSGRGKILRVYIDRAGEEGVSLNDCSEFSNAFSLQLDMGEDLIEGAYNLEVSSPGVERDLKKDWHYTESIGKTIAVNLNQPLQKFYPDIEQQWASRKKLQGTLKSVASDQLSMDFEGREIHLPLQFVSKAHVVFDFGSKQERR